MTEKQALLKAIAMWEFIKKEHLNKGGQYDLIGYSNIYSKTSIEYAKFCYVRNYEYLNIMRDCYLCEYALQKANEENKKSICQFCPVKNWHIYRDKGKECSTCCKGGSVYTQANKFKVIDDTLELLKETYNNYCNNNND